MLEACSAVSNSHVCVCVVSISQVDLGFVEWLNPKDTNLEGTPGIPLESCVSQRDLSGSLRWVPLKTVLQQGPCFENPFAYYSGVVPLSLKNHIILGGAQVHRWPRPPSEVAACGGKSEREAPNWVPLSPIRDAVTRVHG